jgi:hypothetical protein
VISGVRNTRSVPFHAQRGRDNMLPGVASRCTTRLAFIVLTESAYMYTFVGGLAVVVVFVETTENADEMTRCANGAAQLDIRTHFNNHVIKLSA